jgi:hypothetical protein
MKANELRIGNWVFDDENIPMQIAKIESEIYTRWNFNDCSIVLEHKATYYESEIFPIPITEEILLKCGFEDGVVNIFENENFKTSIWYHDGWHFQFDEKEWYGKSSVYLYPAPIDYVHQLQNLYFALTGEELEVNL